MNEVRFGLKENWKQFTLLVIINAFVGGMIGLERTIIPKIAVTSFAIGAQTAILSFIVVFGITKAFSNYYAGLLADKFGRRRLLILGWLFALPVPILLMLAYDWTWVIVANVLLGVNQGLAWSSTVVMKMDLVGEKHRGFAMGLNEFAGYVALAMVAFATGWIADMYGIQPYPFYLGIVISIAGFLMSLFLVKDTNKHVSVESAKSLIPKQTNLFWETTWRNKNLGSITQAGLVNNLNDGMVWGLFPLLLASKGFNLTDTGIVVAIYPAVWGISQLFTGSLADRFCKRNLLFLGMILQGVALIAMVWAHSLNTFIGLSALLGIGTAIVYPTFLAAVSEHTHPEQRPQSIGVFRLWRDLGYAVGAALTGLIADRFGLVAPLAVVGILTLLSAFVVKVRMICASKNPVVHEFKLSTSRIAEGKASHKAGNFSYANFCAVLNRWATLSQLMIGKRLSTNSALRFLYFK